ncbi:MAG: N-acetylneuraminate synthase family protein [Planctomycetota bacterium]|jgi:CMP-N-acetylneuraminic acid synthetase
MHDAVDVIAVVIGRAGSRGLTGKNHMMTGGRPMVCHTLERACTARSVRRVVVSTDSEPVAQAAALMGVQVVRRPPRLATDEAPVDAAVRHAIDVVGDQAPIVVILYANVPIRPPDLIDRAVRLLVETGADSVQSYTPVGKCHPAWMVTIDDAGRVRPCAESTIDRRQDLPKMLIPDGGVIAVTRRSLFTSETGNPHAFLGKDRRGIELAPGSVIDVDSSLDFAVADAMLERSQPDRVRIGDREIGPGVPPYVIAELGVNHDGSPARALELVAAAGEAGADAVKLQLFDANSLLSRAARLAEYQQRAGAVDPVHLLRSLELTPRQMEPIVARAHELGLHAIATVFSLELVEAAHALRWDAFKVASPDVINRPLIEALLATGKPMLVSTGAATPAEVEAVTRWLGSHPHLLMHCVSAYPTPDECAGRWRWPVAPVCWRST